MGVEQDIALSHVKHGDKGYIKLMLTFRPEIIAKNRKNTSTFSTAGRAATQIGHLPVSAGKGVLNGVTGVFRRGHGSDSSDDERSPVKESNGGPPVPVPGPAAAVAAAAAAAVPAGQAQVTQSGASLMPVSATFPSLTANGNNASSEPGTLRVSVLDAKDLSTSDTKPYVAVRVGDKEQKTKHIKSSTPEW